MLDGHFTEPTDEDSTELGEVPQSTEKGSIRPGYNHDPYWMSYMLEGKKPVKKNDDLSSLFYFNIIWIDTDVVLWKDI